jgi:hypothetical protein
MRNGIRKTGVQDRRYIRNFMQILREHQRHGKDFGLRIAIGWRIGRWFRLCTGWRVKLETLTPAVSRFIASLDLQQFRF